MRRDAILATLAAATLLACGGSIDPNAPLDTHRDEERDVAFVTPEDLHDWMEAGHADEVVFIDNRNLFTFEQQRIAGARLIPTDDVQNSLGSLPLNKWAVFYCT
jgi:predicted sulfurtransferase